MDDHKRQADQAAASSDAGKILRGIERIDQQLPGAGLSQSDYKRQADQAAASGDAGKILRGIERIDQQLDSKGTELPAEVIHVGDDVEIRFDDLKPNAIYEKNSYRCHTDEHGRPKMIGGYLQDQKGTRSPQQTEVGHQGKDHDEGGHLIATRFNGPTDGFNLVPQDMNLNRGAWKTMENEWDQILAQGGQVEVAISPIYLDNTRRPMGFDVMYRIVDQSGDNYYTKSFYNESAKEG